MGFEVVGMEEAPPAVRQVHDRLHTAAGLYVVDDGAQTYLLLCAGRADEVGLGVQVLEIARAEPGGQARILATLQAMPEAQTDYPCGLMQVEGNRDVKYLARLSTREQGVLEFTGITVTDP